MVYLLEESRPSNKYIHEKKMGRKFKKHALGKDEKRKKGIAEKYFSTYRRVSVD